MAGGAGRGAGGARVWVLRHAERGAGSGFREPLTARGRDQARGGVAEALGRVPRLRAVYSSPFRRCLETAEPFVGALGLRTRVDYSLYEHPDPPGDAPGPQGLPAEWVDEFSVDPDYCPSYPAVALALTGNASGAQLRQRVLPFLRDKASLHAAEEAGASDAGPGEDREGGEAWEGFEDDGRPSIVLVTHQSVCHQLLGLDRGLDIRRLDAEYQGRPEAMDFPVGGLAEILRPL